MLEGRQEQIAEKLEEVKRRQQESLDRREELLRELEIANQLTQREQERAQAEQEAIKQELKEQVGLMSLRNNVGCCVSSEASKGCLPQHLNLPLQMNQLWTLIAC